MKKIIALCAILPLVNGCVDTPKEPEITQALWLDQGWTQEQRLWFHHESQGTATFPIPYEWFMALERPIQTKKWFKSLTGKDGKFSDTAYLSRFGFIPSQVSASNPDGLPIGFAKTKISEIFSQPGYNAIGMTCAGCHTSQFSYKGSSIRVDGGPAVTSLTAMGEAMAIALIETRALPLRYARFEKAVLKTMLAANPSLDKAQAKSEFKATFKTVVSGLARELKETLATGKASVEEGFSRLDALNRIGNTVFGAYNKDNIVPTDAPVNYPHIWSTSWFDWVQYDGSIMQPMTRNAGEALGVAAPVILKPGPHQFASNVKVSPLYEMEQLLAGPKHPQQAKAFTGLKAPKWPDKILGQIDQDKAAQGKQLYEQHCAGCHRPAVSSDEFWSDKYWKPIKGQGDNFYQVVIVGNDVIGTDPSQSEILANRTVNINGMEMEGDVCGVVNKEWTNVSVKSEEKVPFAFALGLVVERTVDHYYDKNQIDQATREKMNGARPNCLQAPKGYKARPLNGVWATAPFMHNGSVPNLYEMLLPADQRTSTVYLGYREYDPVNVGYISTKAAGIADTKGLTKVVVSGDKARKGNLNSGHEFSDRQGKGVIGPLLTESERRSLVEYLKTI